MQYPAGRHGQGTRAEVVSPVRSWAGHTLEQQAFPEGERLLPIP